VVSKRLATILPLFPIELCELFSEFLRVPASLVVEQHQDRPVYYLVIGSFHSWEITRTIGDHNDHILEAHHSRRLGRDDTEEYLNQCEDLKQNYGLSIIPLDVNLFAWHNECWPETTVDIYQVTGLEEIPLFIYDERGKRYNVMQKQYLGMNWTSKHGRYEVKVNDNSSDIDALPNQYYKKRKVRVIYTNNDHFQSRKQPQFYLYPVTCPKPHKSVQSPSCLWCTCIAKSRQLLPRFIVSHSK